MKKLAFVLALLASLTLHAQSVTFIKQAVGASGCSVLMPKVNAVFDKTPSQDSSDVYSGYVTISVEDVAYDFGCICIKLSPQASGLSHDDQQLMLFAYLEYLKGPFAILIADEYVKNLTLTSNPKVSGVKANWEDTKGNLLQIKGWANADYLIVQYISGHTNYPNVGDAERYLNGIEFPN